MRHVYQVDYSGNDSSEQAQQVFGTFRRAVRWCRGEGFRDLEPVNANLVRVNQPGNADEWLTIWKRPVR